MTTHHIQNETVTIAAGEQRDIVIVHAEAAEHKAATRYVVEAGAHLRVFAAVFAGAKWTVTAELHDNSSFEFRALYIGREQHTIQIDPIAEHIGKHTRSLMSVNGVAFDSSRAGFAGNIVIAETGAFTDAHLEHEGLLMSPKAQISALPGLEVDTNEVKASHSSAIHFLRPEQIFYLQSRGLDEATARDLIVRGFVEAAVADVPDDSVRENMLQLAGL